MIMESNYKEVYFDEYCKTCEYEKLTEDDETCDFCLDHPVNVDSHKPVNYKKRGD